VAQNIEWSEVLSQTFFEIRMNEFPRVRPPLSDLVDLENCDRLSELLQLPTDVAAPSREADLFDSCAPPLAADRTATEAVDRLATLEKRNRQLQAALAHQSVAHARDISKGERRVHELQRRPADSSSHASKLPVSEAACSTQNETLLKELCCSLLRQKESLLLRVQAAEQSLYRAGTMRQKPENGGDTTGDDSLAVENAALRMMLEEVREEQVTTCRLLRRWISDVPG
jgi:hypothetical protein